jgi:hypothetical protein
MKRTDEHKQECEKTSNTRKLIVYSSTDRETYGLENHGGHDIGNDEERGVHGKPPLLRQAAFLCRGFP